MKPNRLASTLLLGTFLFASPLLAALSPPADTAVHVAGKQTAESQRDAAAFQAQKKSAEFSKKLIVARVGEAEINYFDLVRKMNEIVSRKFPQGAPELPAKTTTAIKHEALDRLVLDQLMVNEAIRQNIVIPEADVQDVIDKLKKGYGGMEGYQGYLDEKGITDQELRSAITRSRMLQAITKQEWYGKVKVDPADLQKIYDQYKAEGKLRKIEKYVVQDLLILGDASEENRQKAEDLLAEIKKNNNDMGKLVLDGTFIVRRLHILQKSYPAMHEAIAKMQVNQLSSVIEDRGKLHIFKVVELDPARDLTMEEADGFLTNRLQLKAQEERQAVWHDELRQRYAVEIFLDEVEKGFAKKSANNLQ